MDQGVLPFQLSFGHLNHFKSLLKWDLFPSHTSNCKPNPATCSSKSLSPHPTASLHASAEGSQWLTQHYSHFGFLRPGYSTPWMAWTMLLKRPRTEQVDDNKMDWPGTRWAAKQHKLSTPSLRARLISPAARLFRSGMHFLKFSSFLTFWKILPEILGSLQAMGGSRGAARVDKWLRSRLEAETTAAKKQISREEQGREGMNKKKGNVLVNFMWLFEPLPDTRASHLNLTHFSFAFCSSPLREHKAEEVGIYGLQPFPSVSPCYFQRFSI